MNRHTEDVGIDSDNPYPPDESGSIAAQQAATQRADASVGATATDSLSEPGAEGATALAAQSDPPTGQAPSGPSTATIVWGLLLVAVAGVIGADALSGWAFDPVLTTGIVVLAAGILLLFGAAAGGLRRGRRP